MSKIYMVDLGARPKCPKDTNVFKHEGEGVVIVELRDDDHLYVDGKKYDLFWPENQKNESELGMGLYEEILKLDGFLNSNVLDCLVENPELVPKHWIFDSNGKGFHYQIIFWGAIFSDIVTEGLVVRCLQTYIGAYWNCKPHADYKYLDREWRANTPAVRLVPEG